MKCIYCGHDDTITVDSRLRSDNTVRRRKMCRECKERFTTYEMSKDDVIKLISVAQKKAYKDGLTVSEILESALVMFNEKGE